MGWGGCNAEYKEDTSIVTKNATVVVKRVPAPKTGGLLAKIKALDAAAALQSSATYDIPRFGETLLSSLSLRLCSLARLILLESVRAKTVACSCGSRISSDWSSSGCGYGVSCRSSGLIFYKNAMVVDDDLYKSSCRMWGCSEKGNERGGPCVQAGKNLLLKGDECIYVCNGFPSLLSSSFVAQVIVHLVQNVGCALNQILLIKPLLRSTFRRCKCTYLGTSSFSFIYFNPVWFLTGVRPLF